MLTRINFLLAFGLLVVIVFYFAGSYLLVAPLSRIAPDWVKPVAGLALLAGLGLTVQILSMVMGGMAGVASYRRPEGPGAMAIASQAAIVCGHGGLGYGAVAFFFGERPVTDLGVLVVGALYAAGVAIGILEWRQRESGAQ